MVRVTSLLLAAAIGIAACSGTGSSQGAAVSTADEPAAPINTTTTTTEESAPLSATELGELFLQALNSGDTDAVAALAPRVPIQDLQDVIGSGPYDAVDCQIFNGQDVCNIIHEAAAYEFVLDLEGGLVTSISYVGGA